MHILDLIMYFVTVVLLWFITDKITIGDLEKEIRVKGCQIVIFIHTIVYILIFVFVDYNWIDIFHNIGNFKLNIQL